MRRLLIILIAVLTITAGVGPAIAAGTTTAATGTAQSDVACDYPIELEDATGEQFTFDEQPDSIVALYPSDAQLVFRIGADDRLDGMPIGEYTDSLDVDGQTDISADDGVTPVAEEIIALEPDIVIASDVVMFDEELLEQLRDAGLDVYVYDTAESIDEIHEDLETAGQLTGSCTGAEIASEWMDDRLSIVETALEDEPRPLALYMLDDQGFTTGSTTFQHEVLTTAGVENLAAEAGIEGWEPISDETVIEHDPDWILYGDDAYDEPPVSEAVHETTAMQEGQHFGIDANAASQPAPDVVFAVEEIFAGVHGDVHAEVEADLETVDEEYESSLAAIEESDGDDDSAEGADTDESSDDDVDASPDQDTDDSGDDTEDSIPGFGVPVAVAALVGLLGFRLRQR
ncbi:PGF-CTERM-anchored ABC transporter substrate-binding protein [Natronosalvus vescus]|uniref:PGF-CTERM-anchored ABC transporter substrate-binding protein n=1 Tax=Natronosalvus vescus TaxID=2953881 RepID=UPI00209193E0|nr:PGF-CTERM-anchored ABC transporter substrate-binding protein [Natronosalvus vescus]